MTLFPTITADHWRAALERKYGNPVSEEIARRNAEHYKKCLMFYNQEAAPILRAMSELRLMFAVMEPITIKSGATLADAEIRTDQVKFILTPEAQKLYDSYERLLELLRENIFRQEYPFLKDQSHDHRNQNQES